MLKVDMQKNGSETHQIVMGNTGSWCAWLWWALLVQELAGGDVDNAGVLSTVACCSLSLRLVAAWAILAVSLEDDEEEEEEESGARPPSPRLADDCSSSTSFCKSASRSKSVSPQVVLVGV
jgi:hypothetical protein